MMILRVMRILLIILIFLAAFLPIYLNVSAFATKTHNHSDERIPEAIKIDSWEFLQTYNRSFSAKGDLNNDGEEEEVLVFRQWDGEGWWSEDTWYVLCILDKNQNIIYGNEISYFQVVDGLLLGDVNGDGFKEIVVSLNPTRSWSPKTYTYGWRGGGYKRIP